MSPRQHRTIPGSNQIRFRPLLGSVQPAGFDTPVGLRAVEDAYAEGSGS